MNIYFLFIIFRAWKGDEIAEKTNMLYITEII